MNRIRSVFLMVFAVLLSGLVTSYAQELPGDPEGKIISSLDVQYLGTATVDRERILANMSLREGQPYSHEAARDDIKNLRERRIVEYLEILPELTNGTVKVTVMVAAAGSLGEVTFEGNARLDDDELRDEVKAPVGQPLDEVQLLEGKFNIEELYRDKGFSDVTVTYRTTTDPDTGFSRVIYSISEGESNKLRNIYFYGNTAITEKDLRKVMATKERSLWSRIAGSNKVDNLVLEDDKLKIEREFQNQGFMDARISGQELRRVDAESEYVDLLLYIDEGQKYEIGEVQLSGNTLFSNVDLSPQVKMAPGQTYSAKGIADDEQRIEDYYGSRGYADARVMTRIESLGDNRLRVNYGLIEGEKSYIRRINITGQEYTKDSVIRRELSVAPGDEFNTVKLRESRGRLDNTRFFSEVQVTPEDTEEPGYKDININVAEGETGNFQIGAAFTSVENLFGYMEFSESNFDLSNWSRFPPRGAGQKFRFRLQWGTRTKDFLVGMTEPWFLGQRLALGGEVFYREMLYLSSEYSQRMAGGAIWLRRPVGNAAYLQAEYRLQEIEIYDLDDDRMVDRDGDGVRETLVPGVSPEIAAEEGSYLESKLSLQYVRDTRDDNRLPRTGNRLALGTSVSGGFLAGDVDTYEMSAAFTQHVSFPWDTILTFHSELAVVDSWGDSDRVPIFNRQFLGGAYNLRGFRYREVGPVDGQDEPIGGNTSAYFTLEYSFPVVTKLRGAVFYDAGFVNADSYDFSGSDLNTDIGLGIRFESPFGPIRLDYAFPIEKSEHQDDGGRFNFNLGYRF